MKKILDYLKIAVFVAAVLAGVQVPGFIDQYGKNLNARLSESAMGVDEFQDEADKFFDGDINRLLAYYASKVDPVIVSGGESIEALVSRNQLLRKAQQAFSRSAYRAYVHVLFSPVEDVREDVWNNYTHSIMLNGSAISIGIVAGLIALALFELTIFLLGLAIHSLKVSKPPRRGETQ